MLSLGCFARPEERFVGVGEIATGEMRRRIGFVPRDVVENFEAERLQSKANRINVVRGARNPNCAVGFEQARTFLEPLRVEFVNLCGRRAFIPVALIHRNHLPVLAGDSATRKKIGRVSEDQIERFGLGAFEKFKRIAMIQTNTALMIDGFGSRAGFGSAFLGGGQIGIRLENRKRQSQIEVYERAGRNRQGDQDRITIHPIRSSPTLGKCRSGNLYLSHFFFTQRPDEGCAGGKTAQTDGVNRLAATRRVEIGEAFEFGRGQRIDLRGVGLREEDAPDFVDSFECCGCHGNGWRFRFGAPDGDDTAIEGAFAQVSLAPIRMPHLRPTKRAKRRCQSVGASGLGRREMGGEAVRESDMENQ